MTPQRMRVLALVGAAVVVAAVVGWRAGTPGGGEAERTPADTVAVFFEAQRVGDCDLLADLVTEASLSQRGEWTRGDFLDRCARALVGYHPAEGALTIRRGEDDDQRRVRRFRRGGLGTLVKEGGEWRVDVDTRTLTIGRSVADTVRAYVDAYNARDCEALLPLVAEVTRTQAGNTDESHAASQCEALMAEAAGRQPLVVTVLEADPAGLLNGATVDVAVHREDTSPHGGRPERVSMVREGLTWTVMGVEGDNRSERTENGLIPLFAVERT